MSIKPYRFEVVFSGLCALELDDTGATVYLVNATDNQRFRDDTDLSSFLSEFPTPHYPQLSFSMNELDRAGYEFRRPDRIVSGPGGEEIGLVDFFEEVLTVAPPETFPFQAGPLTETLNLGSFVSGTLDPKCRKNLPNRCVGARCRLEGGRVEVLSVSPAGKEELKVDFRPLNRTGRASGQPQRSLADRLIWSFEGLTEPTAIRSDDGSELRFRPDPYLRGTWPRRVRVCVSNYHSAYHRPGQIGLDFLWLYELLDHKESRLDLPVPVYTNGTGGFTGSSGACPPTVLP